MKHNSKLLTFIFLSVLDSRLLLSIASPASLILCPLKNKDADGDGSWGEGADDDEPEVDEDVANTPLPAELPAPYEWPLTESVFPGSVHKWMHVSRMPCMYKGLREDKPTCQRAA